MGREWGCTWNAACRPWSLRAASQAEKAATMSRWSLLAAVLAHQSSHNAARSCLSLCEHCCSLVDVAAASRKYCQSLIKSSAGWWPAVPADSAASCFRATFASSRLSGGDRNTGLPQAIAATMVSTGLMHLHAQKGPSDTHLQVVTAVHAEPQILPERDPAVHGGS